MTDAPTSPPRIAAVIPGPIYGTDALLAAFASKLRTAGWQVGGLLQDTQGEDHLCEITLIDLASGVTYPITEDLGACSTACRLNPAALAEAGHVLRQLALEGADLAIVNRFGKLEAEGQGLAAEMLDLMSREIPVLTVVAEKYLTAWRHFTGDMAIELPPEADALEHWFAALQQPHRP